jgi:hypothetical protein
MHFLRVGVCARDVGRAALCAVAGSDRTFLLRQRCRRVRVFPSGSMTMDDCVRVARPKIERLSAGMEREAVGLLAALLADAVRKGYSRPERMPSANSPSNTPSISSSN